MKLAMLSRYLLLVVFVLASAVVALGQTAELSGVVQDSSQAVVPNAAITLLNENTGIKRTATSNAQGFYTIPFLQPGNYKVTVQVPGFQTVSRPGVTLTVGQQARIDFVLQVGSVAQTITVEGGAPLLNTQSPAVSTVIDRNFAESLPLNGRSFNTLLQLTPGVVITPSSSSAPGQFSINGQRTNANNFIVDGVSANFGISTSGNPNQDGAGGLPAFSAYGGTSSLVSVDALEEFRVQTSTFSPEYGRTPGGQVSITTRSGANEFHGGIFDYFRNDKLDANDWFADAAGIPTAPLRQNDFGGFLGGPIVRDKTFFFFSYEGLRLRLPQTTVVRVPPLALRASAIPAAAPYLNAYPQPNGPDLTPTTAQFTGSFSDKTELNATSLRIDHVLNSKVTLFGRYNDAPSADENRIGSLNSVATSKLDTRTLTLGTTVQLTPRITNSSRANYSVHENDSLQLMDSFGGATPLDPSLLLPAPSSVTDSRVFLSPGDGVARLQMGHAFANRNRQINLINDLSVTAGAHQLKFGVDYRDMLFSFEGNRIILQYLNSLLQDFADTAIVATTIPLATNDTKAEFRTFSLYGQDAWRLGQRLTLTYGLRWESNIAPKGVDGTILTGWANVDDPANVTLAPIGTPLWKTRYDNFAPRVGVAYRVTSDGGLVVRGGWGIYYDLGTGAVTRLTRVFPNRNSLSISGLALPLADLSTVTPVLSVDPPYPGAVQGSSPDLQLPRSHQWNVAIEKALGGEQALSISYVGQAGRKLLRQEVDEPTNPDFISTFLLTDNGDTSDYHALQLQFKRRLSRGLQVLVNHTWSHSIDSNSSDSNNVAPDIATSAEKDRGSSNFDVRHNFSAAVTYELPSITNQGPLAHLTKGWSLDTVVQARTAFPIDISTFLLSIPGATFVATRPDLVPGEPFWLQDGNVGGGRRLNSAAFVPPPTPRQGTLGRNVIRGFGLTQVDLSIGRRFGLTEKVNLQFRTDFFNVLNHPNFTDPKPLMFFGMFFNDRSTQTLNRGLGGLSPLFQIGGPRSLQLSLKLTF